MSFFAQGTLTAARHAGVQESTAARIPVVDQLCIFCNSGIAKAMI
jgi:hypothetical protein